MWLLEYNLISGMMFGLEFVPSEDEDFSTAIVLDLGIFRVVLYKYVGEVNEQRN